MKIRGKAWKFGDNVDTDQILPGIYLNIVEPQELAKHCMEGIDKEFVRKMAKGDVVIGGTNFGCGSSREHAPISLKAVGVSAVIAASFARIFFRNCINIGLPVFESPEAAKAIEQGHEVEADMASGEVKDLTTGKAYKAAGFPPLVQGIIRAGGLVEYAKQQLKARQEG
ncbi:MAG: 3-isopropylmalate dehydratase small subunit [Firmicutes bacterium]|nr:3-isopropylmalate dehydratase small subunit [Bacillota bacterium]